MARVRYPWLVLMIPVCLAGCTGKAWRKLDADEPRTVQKPAATEEDIAVYFSPKGGGMAALVDELNGATRSIDVMAYLITAPEIARALEAAQKRRVEVRVIMDAGNAGGIFSEKAIFADSPVPIWRDGEHKEFHHKVILIDGRIIITGSFNFTTQAEDTNAENLLLIRDHPRLYSAYLAHFNEHLQHSKVPTGKAVVGK